MKTPQINSRLARISKAGVLMLTLLGASQPAIQAADITWSGGTAEYTNTANWTGGVVPGPGDNAINDTGSGNVVQILGVDPAWSVNDIRAANGTSTIGEYYQDGSAVVLGGWFRLGIGTGATGTYTLHSGAITINAARLNVGELGTGVLNIDSGTINGPNNQFALADGPTGSSGTVNQTGGTVTAGGELWIGANNAGSGGVGAVGIYNFSAGALNINNWVAIGRNGTTGTLNMSGGTFNKNNNGQFLVGSGNGSIGTVNLTGGSITAQNQFLVPEAGNGSTLGTLNLSNNASLLVNSWIAVGRNGGVGIANIGGGSMTKTGNGSDHIVLGAGGPGTINQSAGAVTNITSDTWIGENGAGVWNLNGGTANLRNIHIAQTSGNGTLNLNGGSLSTTEITTGNPSSVSILRFNGATVKATANSANFVHGLFIVEMQSGGLVLDSQGFDVTIPQALPTSGDGSGGLTKNGAGALTLTGANSYTGPTVVNNGTLVLTTDPTGPTGQGDYTVAGGAQLNLTVQAQNSELTMANHTFSSGASTLNLDLGSFGNPGVSSAPVNVLNALAINGTLTINIADGLPQLGQFPLIQASSKTVTGSLVLGSLPVGVGAYISNNVSSIDLVITNVNLPRWEGLAGGNWDIGLTTNWVNIGNGFPTTFADHNIVQFNDSATGTTTVNLTTTVTPNGLTVNNNTKLYTFTGPGKITGPVGITKQGPGTLEVFNTGGNNYTGPTVISGGTLSVTNLTNGGLPSPIGAGSANPTNLVLSGGSLSYSGPATTINRGYLVQTTNGGLTTVSNLTLTGVANAINNGGFIKSGDATLTYTTVGSNVLSATGSSGYSVQAGTVVFDGTSGGQTNYSAGGIRVDGLTAEAVVNLTNTTMNIGDLNLGDIASATGTLNINSGTTANVGGWIIFGDGGNSTGTINLNAGTLNALTGDLLMGGRAGANSTLNINNGVINKAGGTVNVAPGNWNGDGARVGTINQIGGTFNCSDELRVGQSAFGSGYYNLTNGVLNAHNGLYVGNGGSFGQFTMVGGTINKDGGNPIKIGNGGGVAVFNQSAGTITSSSEYWIGENGGTLATNNISGSAAVNVSTYVTVGRAGTGVVNMSGGTFTQTGGNPFFVGIFGGGNGYWYQTGGSLAISATLQLGASCNGNFQLDNGVVNAAGEVWIGQAGGSVSSLTINGGAFTNNSWLAVGREDGHGTLNINGGTYVKAGGGNISIAHGIGDQSVVPAGTVNQTGGTFICAGGDTWIGEDSGPGIWNMSGGSATHNLVQLARNANASGELDLNGGTFVANEVTTGSAGTSTLNFNGGTLASRIDNPNFLHGLTAANVQAGGAVIDTGANTISISQPLLNAGGGLTKKGSGSLTLTGNNTYAGSTIVSAGKLFLTTASTGGGDVTVSNGAAFGVTVVNALNSQYLAPSINFAGTTATLNIDLGSFGNPGSAPVSVTTLYNSAAVTVNVADAVPAIGQIPLLKYTGTIVGAGSFVLGTLPNGSVGYLSNNVLNASIDLVVTSAGAPRWDGTVAGGVWDINTTANWFDLGTSLTSTYHDGTTVLFNDAATGTTNVNLTANVTPASVTFSDNTLGYVLTGSGKISGAIGLTKSGSAPVSILNTGGNNFTGPVVISDGALIVTNLANGGSPSPIGASPAAATNLVLLNNATLSYRGAPVTVNRGYSFQGTNATLDVQGDLTLSGAAQANTVGGIRKFSKTGTAQLAYTGSNTNELSLGIFTGGNGTAGFQILQGSVLFDGSAGSQTNHVTSDLWVGSGTNFGASLIVSNTTLNVDNYLAAGRGNGNLANTSSVSIYNSLVNVSGLSLGYNATLPFNYSYQFMTLSGNTLLTNRSQNMNIGESGGSVSSLLIKDTAVLGSTTRCALTSTSLVTVANSGKLLINSFMSIGNGGGSIGSVVLKDNAFMNVQSDLNMGDNGPCTGSLSLSNSAVAVANTIYVGKSANTVGNLTMSPGTFLASRNTGGGSMNVGPTSGDVGNVNISGGQINVVGELWMAAVGQGNWTQSGGNVFVTNWIAVGRSAGSVGTFNISGGSITEMIPASKFIIGSGGTGTINISGTASVNSGGQFLLGENAGSIGTVNLNGGNLTVPQIARQNGTANISFNGGTITVASNANVVFMTGLTTATVKSGGLTVNTGTNIINIGQALLDGTGGGGLTKTGNGTLRLNGTSTYTGTTFANFGGIGGTGLITAPLIVASGATLTPGVNGIGTFTVNNNVTLAAGSFTYAEVNKTSSTSDLLTGVNTLNYGGTLIVTNLGTAFVGGESYKLFNATNYSGSFSAISPATPGPGLAWNTSQLAVSGTISVVTGTVTPLLTTTVSGGNLNVAWPTDHIGYTLQIQTNALSVGLSTNWSAVPNSTTTNAVSIPLIQANPAVFLRLVP